MLFTARAIVLSMVVTGVALVSGCGPNAKSLSEAEARIQELKAKGVPDTDLSSAKVLLSQAQGAIRAGNSQSAGKHYKEALAVIAEVESVYTAQMAEMGPKLTAMKAELEEKTSPLEGLHREPIEKHLALVDSFVQKNWLLQAHQQLQTTDSLVPGLLAQQEQAEKLTPKVRGVWTRSDNEGNAVRREKFVMNKDGTLLTTESKKGQSSEYLKEDWQFTSWGTWQMKGDTVYMLIEREKCDRQTFWNKKNGSWVKSAQPTYDSTITDGSKDRFISYEYLTTNYRKR